jgi:hypothetical protein
MSDEIISSNPEEIGKFMADCLQEFTAEKTEELKTIIKKDSSECAKKVRQDAPKDTGKYAKGWQSSLTDENPFTVTYTINNKTKPTLSHLLENGWVQRPTGKRIKGHPHINQNCEDTGEKIEKDIEALENK